MADHSGNDGSEEYPGEEEFSKDPHFWWYGKDLAKFFATVMKHGYENVYIELREIRKGGEKEAWFIVKRLGSGGEILGGYNDSHVCPPDCSE